MKSLLLAFAGLAFVSSAQSQPKRPPEMPPESILEKALKPGSVYSDELLGVSLKYPEGWSVRSAYRYYGRDNGARNRVELVVPPPSAAQSYFNYSMFTGSGKSLADDQIERFLRLTTLTPGYVENPFRVMSGPADETLARAETRAPAAAGQAHSRSQEIADYQILPSTFVYRRIAGRPGLSYFATFDRGGTVMAEYFVFVVGEKGFAVFFTRGPQHDVKSIAADVDKMAATLEIP